MLASPDDHTLGQIVREYPVADSPLHIDKFFSDIYSSYDLRYVYSAKRLRTKTRRLVWDRESPAVWDQRTAGMTPRIGDDTVEPVPTFEVDSAPEPDDNTEE